jgi:hypothetical protein
MTNGFARAGFDIDLKTFTPREDSFAAILGGDKTVEVKSDQICQYTGNVFVEFEQYGKPSGIAVTSADYWAFEYEQDCWLLVPTGKLKSVARLAYRQGLRRNGGDNNNFTGVLIPISWLTGVIVINHEP